MAELQPGRPRRWGARVDAPGESSPVPVLAGAATVDGPARVLVVEDDETLSDLIAHRLGQDGLLTARTDRAESALELLSRGRFDLLIVDVRLPGMSGFDLCREIRRRHDAVPVMFLTGAGSVQERLAGFDLGGDDYVVKPANLAEVARRVQALLRRARRGGRPAIPSAAPMACNSIDAPIGRR